MIGIISDVHGNYYALYEVIKKLKELQCTKIISLGDIAGYYCMINECIDLCRLHNVINILGNHDQYLIESEKCPRSYTANLCIDYQKKEITKQNFLWLANSKSELDIPPFSFRHGSWTHVDEYIDMCPIKPIQNNEFSVFASGHTHVQKILHYEDYIYFNPGSVGQPRDYDARASFAVIDENNSINLYRVEYDIRKMYEEMKNKGFENRISECLFYGTKIGEKHDR